mgnify:CR=1 FL=1
MKDKFIKKLKRSWLAIWIAFAQYYWRPGGLYQRFKCKASCFHTKGSRHAVFI